MGATPLDTIEVGFVVERRAADSPWVDFTWRVVEVTTGGPEGGWRPLAEGDGWARFFAGQSTLELYRRETEGYRRNLSEPTPVVYVVMQQAEDEGDEDAAPLRPFLATVCPYEAEAYVESGDELVDSAPMPPELIARVQAFVDLHHVDEPFVKRKQKRKDKTVDSNG